MNNGEKSYNNERIKDVEKMAKLLTKEGYLEHWGDKLGGYEIWEWNRVNPDEKLTKIDLGFK